MAATVKTPLPKHLAAPFPVPSNDRSRLGDLIVAVGVDPDPVRSCASSSPLPRSLAPETGVRD